MSHSRRDFLGSSLFAAGLWIMGGRHSHADHANPKPEWPSNPFLQGNFGPVHEEVAAEDFPVVGKIPSELDGMFVRNGPNPQFPPLGNYHWFDGDGMLHGVRIRDGKASYRNRYVRTEGWKEEKEAGKAVYYGLSDPPDLKRLAIGKQPFKNTANTALVWHNGKLLALWEGGPPHEIKVPSLDTVGLYQFGGKLKHAFTAHPKVDLRTGEMLCFGYNPVVKPYVLYSVVNAQGQIVRTTPIDTPKPVMMHDCAVTERHTLFLDLPETFDFSRIAKGEHPFAFEPANGARIGILPRHGEGKEIRWFDISVCFIFHTLNAYDEGDEVVLLACRYQDFPAAVGFFKTQATAKAAKADEILRSGKPILHRWRFNLKTGKSKEEALDDLVTEFPRINEGFMGRPTRYGYAAEEGGDMFGGLVKYDLAKGTRERHSHGQGRMGGEGVFVPRPDAKVEDEGWLVTYIHDAASGKSEMVIVDARDFTAAPVARVKLPARVPHGFHGTWIEGKELS